MGKGIRAGKRIKGVHEATPALKAARRAVDERLKAVEQILPLAARQADEDIEYVHQLRVATRRADAALRMYRAFIPPRRFRKTRRQLRRLRRAAGDARSCDVLRLVVEGDLRVAPPETAASLGRFLAWLDERRVAAQGPIMDVHRKWSRKRMSRRRARVVAAMKRPPGSPRAQTLHDVSARMIPAMAESLQRSARRDLHVMSRLHQFRIRAKRLRYALELAAPCFGDDYRALSRRFQALQEHLGDINDCEDLLNLIAAFAPDLDRADTSLGLPLYRHAVLQRRDTEVAAFLTEFSVAEVDEVMRRLVVRLAIGEGPPAVATRPAHPTSEVRPTRAVAGSIRPEDES